MAFLSLFSMRSVECDPAGYWLQVAQLVPAHEAHSPPVPLTARVPPLLLLLMAENREMAREVWSLPQRTHDAGASALLMGRSFSKVASQSTQWYS